MADEDVRQLLSNWYIRIRATHKGHYKAASLLEKRQKAIGILVVALSAFVGTTLFYSLINKSVSSKMMLSMGLASALATVLSAIQTYLNYPGKQTTHTIAATQLSRLKKRIEEELAVESDSGRLSKFAHEVRVEWDAITHGAPLMPQKVYESCAKVKSQYFGKGLANED